MNPAYTPPPGATLPAPAPSTPQPYETTWLGYEAALPWIRISPPLACAAPRPR